MIHTKRWQTIEEFEHVAQDAEKQQLQRSLNMREAGLATQEQQLASRKSECKHLENTVRNAAITLAGIQEVISNTEPAVKHAAWQELLAREKKYSELTQLALAKHYRFVIDIEERIEELKSERERISLKLESMAIDKRQVTRAEIQKAAASTNCIHPGSVRIKQSPHVTVVEWTFNTLYAPIDTTRTNYFKSFANPIFHLPIGPCRVQLNVNDSRILFMAVGAQNEFNYFGNTYRSVHPHVLAAHAPCLGSLQGPMAEAIHAMDFDQIMAIAQLFLQTVTLEDNAGITWHRYLLRQGRVQLGRYNILSIQALREGIRIVQDPSTKAIAIHGAPGTKGPVVVHQPKRVVPKAPTLTKDEIKRRFRAFANRSYAHQLVAVPMTVPVSRPETNDKFQFIYTVEEALTA